MEIPDPAPEMVITLPKRGKIRVTSIEEADALIIAATRAKSMLITLLAFEPAEFDEPDETWTLTPAGAARLDEEEAAPLPQRTPGSTLAEPECDAHLFGAHPTVNMADGTCRCIVCPRCRHHTGNSHQGHYWAACSLTRTLREFHFCCPDDEFGCELGEPAQAEIAGDVPPCPEHHPATSAPCARLSGHPLPHKPLHGSEWGGEPHHATDGEPRCEAYDDIDGEGRICNAQKYHGGTWHLMYGDDGMVAYRWPVADDYHPGRWLVPDSQMVTVADENGTAT